MIIYNEEIFSVKPEYFSNAIIQLCISSENVNKAKYIEQIKHLKLTYIDSSIRLHIIDSNTDMHTLNIKGFNTNISQYIEDNIPNHLDKKYEMIKKKLAESQ